jgi:succinate dehydrogenase cytochrome b556 subunit
MFVWIFHRVSGVFLILLLLVQIISGFFQASLSNSALTKSMAELHRNAALNCLLVFLILFHALYGLRTILLDLGITKEKLLFWACTAVGVVFYVVFLVLYFALVK